MVKLACHEKYYFLLSTYLLKTYLVSFLMIYSMSSFEKVYQDLAYWTIFLLNYTTNLAEIWTFSFPTLSTNSPKKFDLKNEQQSIEVKTENLPFKKRRIEEHL